MKLVKLTQDVRSRRAGEVLEVDDASAASLVEKRKVATYFDPDTDTVDAVRTAPRLGNAAVVQVADADIPPAPTPPDGVDGATGTELEGDIVVQDPPSADDPKPELVARLVAATADTDEPITAEEAEKLTRAEIVAKLGQIPQTSP